MHATLQQQLVPAQLVHLIDLLNIFIHAGDIAGFVVHGLVKIAEFASRNAGIGDIHIAVDDPADLAVRMLFFPELIGNPHQIGQRKFAEKGRSFSNAEEFGEEGFVYE